MPSGSPGARRIETLPAWETQLMRIGISLTSGYGDLDERAAVNAVIGRARAAADAGLDHLSLGDQHSTGLFAP